MKYLRQFGIILFISFLGEILHLLLPFPIPASIYGIVLLFAALETRLLKVAAIRETSSFLLDIMPILFVPGAVEFIDKWSILRPVLIPFTVITLVSTFTVLFASGRVTQAVMRIRSKRKENRHA